MGTTGNKGPVFMDLLLSPTFTHESVSVVTAFRLFAGLCAVGRKAKPWPQSLTVSWFCDVSDAALHDTEISGQIGVCCTNHFGRKGAANLSTLWS